ncbi:MAG: tRNA pseudouridine(55) synthase TruB [Phycisphaeraceae bacterium]|nr:tRNA pseudouridine(55) synthase TruB [Phycisphaeraceae bacterium]
MNGSEGTCRPAELPSGFVVVDKPRGMRSTQVVRWVQTRVRAGLDPRIDVKASKRMKVGHGGTLDPLATGVMVVMVGKATKLCERVMGQRKGYLAEVDLSRWSVTDDHESEARVVENARVPRIADVEATLARYTGVIEQLPPAHSAMRVDGQRAYDIARRGEDPGLKARAVTIYSIVVVAYEFPLLSLDIACGRGTYIRSLARDIGRELSGGGMLHSLRRTRVGAFTLELALTVPDGPCVIGPEALLPLGIVDDPA